MVEGRGGNRARLFSRIAVLFLASLAGIQNLIAQDVDQNAEQNAGLIADFIWSEESSQGSRIVFARHSEGIWSKPTTVAENAGLNILPAIAAAGLDDMLAVWSSVTPKGINLYYSRYLTEPNSDTGNWSDAKLLTAKRVVNLAPVLLAVSGSYHVFWSAHEGSDDDIFASRLASGGWIIPQQIHDDNAEVDALPVAGFDPNQRIWVRWESIGTDAAEKRILVYETGNSSGKTDNAQAVDLEALEKESLETFNLEPPIFFRSKSRATMYIHNFTTHPVRLFQGNVLP